MDFISFAVAYLMSHLLGIVVSNPPCLNQIKLLDFVRMAFAQHR